jgi:hypothetical protein
MAIETIPTMSAIVSAYVASKERWTFTQWLSEQKLTEQWEAALLA